MPGNPYDGHTLREALEQAQILSNARPEIAVVDRGYRGVEVDGSVRRACRTNCSGPTTPLQVCGPLK